MARTGRQKLSNTNEGKETKEQKKARIQKAYEAKETFYKVYVPILAAFLLLLTLLVWYRTTLVSPKLAQSVDDIVAQQTIDEEVILADEVVILHLFLGIYLLSQYSL
eukprot:Sdes_comp17455_c0_seq2m6684